MATTFLKAHGLEIGTSYYEPEALETAARLAAKAEGAGKALLLPSDCVVAPALEASTTTPVVAVTAVPHDHMIVDIGPETVAAYGRVVASARTVVRWGCSRSRRSRWAPAG
jgi:phosphoglycerate kinase